MNEAYPLGVHELPPYRVVCLEMDPELAGAGHQHVTSIETWDPDGGRTRWTPVQVIAAIRDGERYVVESTGQGLDGLLEPAVCPRCPMVTLTVDPPGARPAPCG